MAASRSFGLAATTCRAAPAMVPASPSEVGSDYGGQQRPMPNQPFIVFDVNETLLDLETIRPAFDGLFDDPAAMRLWFGG